MSTEPIQAKANVAAEDAQQKPAHAWLPTPIDAAARREMVAQAAYFRAEKRAFAPGFELEDWLEAEREIARTFGS